MGALNSLFLNEGKEILNNLQELKCPDCGSYQIIEDCEYGEFVCKDCGLVLSDLVFYKEPPMLNENVKIRLNNLAKRKNNISPKLKRALYIGNQLNWNERSKTIASKTINRIASQLKIPKFIQNSALRIYEQAQKKNLIKGFTINSIAASTLYISCRQNNYPITLEDIERISMISEKKLKTSIKKLRINLNLRIVLSAYQPYITRFCSDLNLDEFIEIIAQKIADICFKSPSFIGKSQKGVIGAVIYIACQINKRRISQSTIADKLKISDVTLRTRAKEITLYLRRKKCFQNFGCLNNQTLISEIEI
ncbi:MAG: transcription initiation factor IIB [Promethearchaeota archaeon]